MLIAAGSLYVVIVAIALRFALAPISRNSDIGDAIHFFAWLVVGISLFSLACAAVLSVGLRRIGLARAAANDIVGKVMWLALGAVPFTYAVLPAALSPLVE